MMTHSSTSASWMANLLAASRRLPCAPSLPTQSLAPSSKATMPISAWPSATLFVNRSRQVAPPRGPRSLARLRLAISTIARNLSARPRRNFILTYESPIEYAYGSLAPVSSSRPSTGRPSPLDGLGCPEAAWSSDEQIDATHPWLVRAFFNRLAQLDQRADEAGRNAGILVLARTLAGQAHADAPALEWLRDFAHSQWAAIHPGFSHEALELSDALAERHEIATAASSAPQSAASTPTRL